MSNEQGTQTDEVRAALAMVARLRRDAAGWRGPTESGTATADLEEEAANLISVLSAEIERLTRRVEERERQLIEVQHKLIDRNHEYGMLRLASAAAPDELADDPCIPAILAHKAQEREACVAAVKEVGRFIPEDAESRTAWQSGKREGVEQAVAAIRARTPDQDTAP